ncbi:hypothetical protein GpartN1_g315.t1 [Galdieria partita]|uniref:RING-type domain-containing protein n=1 Tax=Galdieria partita TaxID=83374 RepID=A0A9C7PQU1_9RHOD|nr:hypothetical protein GpartN1_g315.t1 [Galdieria partita]
MFGNNFSFTFSNQASQANRKRYFCHHCRRYFVLVFNLDLGSDWCPQCSLCGSAFVEECSQGVEARHYLTRENTETRPTIYSDEWETEEVTSTPQLEGLPVAPSIDPAFYIRPNTGLQNPRLNYSTASSTASTSNVTESSSTWQHVLERLWDAFSRLRSSRREHTSMRSPTSAHTTATSSNTSHSALYTSSAVSGGVSHLPMNSVSTSRRVRRRTREHMQSADNLIVEEIWERELATLYQQLLFTQNDPEEYARVQTVLSSMLDCLLELYSQRSNPTSKSFVDSLEGQLLTEQEAKEAESCAICWEDFQPNTVVVFLPCSHLFCKKCICTWLKENSTCPTCRYKLPVDKVVSTH